MSTGNAATSPGNRKRPIKKAFITLTRRYAAQVDGRAARIIADPLTPPPLTEQIRTLKEKLLASQEVDDQWDLIHQINLLALEAAQGPTRVNEVAILEFEYAEIFSNVTLEALRTRCDVPVKLKDGSPQQLLAWGTALAEELQYRYSVLWELEEQREAASRTLVRILAGWVLLATGILIAVRMKWPNSPTILPCYAAVAGAIGSVIFMYRNIQILTFRDNPDLAVKASTPSLRFFLLKTTVAAVFALVLYLFMKAGYLEGSLFPDFTVQDSKNGAFPLVESEFAKLLLWGFLAGFSEKLVPSKLEQLAADAK